MMLFQFIPYILVAQLGVNDKKIWEHGPEYNFSGFLKMITSLKQDMEKPLGTGVYFNLKCRPREPDILRCQLLNTTITRLKPQSFGPEFAEPDSNDTHRYFNIIKVPFEIKFNERGIDSFITESKNAPVPWSLNEVRLIASQLNIGIDPTDKMGSAYKAMENFTIGECNVDFSIAREPIILHKEGGSNFELSPFGKLGEFSDESIAVTKRRNVTECLRCIQPFFGSRYTLGLLLRDVLTKLETSYSRISMHKYHFTSETINESDVYDQNREHLGKVLDHMTLTLESITPAMGKIPEFSEPLIWGGLTDITDDATS